ncbi:MAG: superoxide dismutase family protein [Acidimicrobiales bacterium]
MDSAKTFRWAAAALTAPVLLAACGDNTAGPGATTTALATTTTALPAADAKTTLKSADGATAGVVTFSVGRTGTVVDVQLMASKDVKPSSFHGIHVHANDDPANGEGCKADPAMPASTWFTAVDGHLKEGTATHKDHTGDLPSVLVGKDGTASLRFTTDRLTPSDVAGKAVVVHAGADNFGNVPVGTGPDQYTPNAGGASTKTEATGNAGDRMLCGVIAKT